MKGMERCRWLEKVIHSPLLVRTARLMFSRKSLAQALDPELRAEEGLSGLNRLLLGIIIFSVFLAVVGTEHSLHERYRSIIGSLEGLILIVFAVEFSVRLWVCTENPRFSSRWNYMARPMVILDLFVIFIMATSLLGFEGALFRLLRVSRLLRAAKLGRFGGAFHSIYAAFAARRHELMVSVTVAVGLLLVSASALYVLEGNAQPEYFGSIPRAMWWSVATLTTVGYGDVFPITPLGRVFAAITAITGIGLIAMPAGILASAFSEALGGEKK